MLQSATYPPIGHQVTISRAAYFALSKMLDRVKETGKEWQELPMISDSKNRANHVQELVKTKKICEERFTPDHRRELRLSVDFDLVLPSKYASNKIPKALNKLADECIPASRKKNGNILPSIQTTQNKAVSNPVSLGRYKPTVHDVREFIKVVDEWMSGLHQEATAKLTQDIQSTKELLLNAHGADERKLTEELRFMIQERDSLSVGPLIDAIKDFAAESRFRQFNFDEWFSINPEDYAAK